MQISQKYRGLRLLIIWPLIEPGLDLRLGISDQTWPKSWPDCQLNEKWSEQKNWSAKSWTVLPREDNERTMRWALSWGLQLVIQSPLQCACHPKGSLVEGWPRQASRWGKWTTSTLRELADSNLCSCWLVGSNIIPGRLENHHLRLVEIWGLQFHPEKIGGLWSQVAAWGNVNITPSEAGYWIGNCLGLLCTLGGIQRLPTLLGNSLSANIGPFWQAHQWREPFTWLLSQLGAEGCGSSAGRYVGPLGRVGACSTGLDLAPRTSGMLGF